MIRRCVPLNARFRRQQVCLGNVDLSPSSANIEHQIFHVEYRLKDTFGLAIEVPADQGIGPQ
jgi:hypothetical protein